MANVLILGGGFGGVVAAERLAQQLSAEHHITLVSRSRNFVFYPALVRLLLASASQQTSHSTSVVENIAFMNYLETSYDSGD